MRHPGFLILLLSLTLTASMALAEDPFGKWQHFSATRTGKFFPEPVKIYRSGTQLRTEHHDQIHITSLKEGGNATLTGGKCVWIPMPDSAAFPFDSTTSYKDFNLERTPIKGDETVDGHPTKMETLIYSQKSKPDVRVKLKLWEAQDLEGFPVKIEVSPYGRTESYVITYSDVSFAPPDPAVFKVPANCQHMPEAKTQPAKRSSPTKPAAEAPPPFRQ